MSPKAVTTNDLREQVEHIRDIAVADAKRLVSTDLTKTMLAAAAAAAIIASVAYNAGARRRR